jgi:hypothetical protein
MDKQDNQRDIDTLLQESLRGSAEPRPPLYQNKHERERITVHVNGRYDYNICTSSERIIELYEQEPDVPLDVFDPDSTTDEAGRKKGKPLTTEKERRELIDFLKASVDFEKKQKNVQKKAKEDLRTLCRNLPIDSPTDTSCNFELRDLRQYLCKRDNVEQFDMNDPDIAASIQWQIDYIIFTVINPLIFNKNFLIEGGKGKDREQIAYKNYRMGRASGDVVYFVSEGYFDQWAEGEQDTSHLKIDARNHKGVITESWEWQNITFNEAQIKEVFPIAGENANTLKTLEIATKEQVLEAAERVGNGNLATNDQARLRVQEDLAHNGLRITKDSYQTIIREELEIHPEKQSPKGRPSKQETKKELCG